jgi:type I restriction enzyme S subunit
MSYDTCLLSDIATIQGGYAFKSADFGEVGVAVVKIANIQPPFVSTNNVDRVKESTVEGLDRFKLADGDILMAMTGATVGKVGRFKETETAYLNQRVARIKSKKGGAFDDFVYAVVTQPGFEKLIEGVSAGSAQANISAQGIGSVRIPSLTDDQKIKIGALAKSLNDSITILREMNTTLETIAQTIFKSWFVKFEYIKNNLGDGQIDSSNEDFTELIPESFIQSELGEIPKGWSVQLLGDYLDVLETGRRPKGGVSGIDGGIPSIGAESIVKIGEFDFQKLKFVSMDFFEKMKSGKLQSRDVLLYKDGGKPGVFLPRVSMFGDEFPFDVCGINEHVFRMRIKKPFSQTFLYFWLWSDAVMHELKHRGGKAAIPGINQSDVKDLKIAVPAHQLLMRFEKITEPIVSRILANSKKMKTLTDLRSTLLPHLISGQLKLSETDALTERAVA